jgi:hypothetical protein
MSESVSHDSPVASSAEVGEGTGPPQHRPGFARRTTRGLVAALRFLLPFGHAPAAEEGIWRATAHWLIVLGFLTGLIWTGWFSFLWWKFGQIERIRVIPALGVLLLDVTFLGYTFFRGTILTVQEILNCPRTNRKDSSGLQYQPNLTSTLAVVLLLLTKFGLIVSIPTTPLWWPSDWRQHLMWMYPETVYRPLLLAPMWASWGMLLAAAVGRVSENRSAPVAALGRAVTPTIILSWFVALTVGTAIYCSHHGNVMVGVILSLLVLGVTFSAAALVAQRLGGQTEHSVYAAGQLAQLSFLTGFLAFGPYVFGP